MQQPAPPVAPAPASPLVPAVRTEPPQTAPDKVAEPPAAPEKKTDTTAKPPRKRKSGGETPACGGYYPPAGCFPVPWCR
jgi:hypothetical protein